MKYRIDIQIIRAVAVLLVLFFHLDIPGFENGYFGVDIFFVVSGFLMAQLYEKYNTLDFYLRRFKRLLPAYLVTIGITTFAIGIVSIPPDANQSFSRFFYNLLGLSNIGFWFEDTYFDKTNFKPLLNLWSLGVEIQYYLIVPLLLPLIRRNKIIQLTIFLAMLSFCVLISAISPKTSFYMMPFRIWEFILGAIICWNLNKGATKWNVNISIILLITLISVLFIPIEENSKNLFNSHPGLITLIPVFITALALYKPLNLFKKKNSIIHFFEHIGNYSYSIYLVHFPIIVLYNYKPFGGTILGYDSIFDLFNILFFTAICSFLLFNYVENLRIKTNFLPKFSIILLVTICISYLGKEINSYGYSAEQRMIFSSIEKNDNFRCGQLFRILNPSKNICPIGTNQGEKNILLLGNSHADSIKIPLSQTINNENSNLFMHISNRVLIDKQYNYQKLILDIKSNQIESVIIHFSPSFYSSEKRLKELEKMVIELKKVSIPFVFISPVPVFKFNVPRQLYLETISQDEALDMVDVKEYEQSIFGFREFLMQNGISKDDIYDVHEILCSKEKICTISHNGKSIYIDSNHLSSYGAQLLTPIFKEISLRHKN
tara:strand:- start:1305 stop:3110 length:1806 start_codon:yes stop_codon:yes gene_type:complete